MQPCGPPSLPGPGASAIVQARIDGENKEEAMAVLAAMGLTMSHAIRLLNTRIAREKALPFEPLVPNDEGLTATHLQVAAAGCG